MTLGWLCWDIEHLESSTHKVDISNLLNTTYYKDHAGRNVMKSGCQGLDCHWWFVHMYRSLAVCPEEGWRVRGAEVETVFPPAVGCWAHGGSSACEPPALSFRVQESHSATLSTGTSEQPVLPPFTIKDECPEMYRDSSLLTQLPDGFGFLQYQLPLGNSEGVDLGPEVSL